MFGQQTTGSTGLGYMSPRISSPAHPSSGGSTPGGGGAGRGGGRGRGVKRDTSLIGKTVKIVGGPFKGRPWQCLADVTQALVCKIFL